MPSLKAIIEGGPVRTARFDWGGDEIVMRVKMSGVTVGEVVSADLTEVADESDVEKAARTQAFVADAARTLERVVVEWNMWLDDEETMMFRSYDDMLLLPIEFLLAARTALQQAAEVDASGGANGVSGAG